MARPKPTKQQQARIPHHLIDIAPPDYSLSLAEYQDAAYRAIEEILGRGKIPFLVGGSGQYITALEEGWSIPRVPPDRELRAELEAYARAKLAREPPRAPAPGRPGRRRTHPPHNNARRVIRALEVCMLTGQAISDLQRGNDRRPIASSGWACSCRAQCYIRAWTPAWTS